MVRFSALCYMYQHSRHRFPAYDHNAAEKDVCRRFYVDMDINDDGRPKSYKLELAAFAVNYAT
jgi:hypothetical protein